MNLINCHELWFSTVSSVKWKLLFIKCSRRHTWLDMGDVELNFTRRNMSVLFFNFLDCLAQPSASGHYHYLSVYSGRAEGREPGSRKKKKGREVYREEVGGEWGGEERGGEGSTCGVKTWLEAGETWEIWYCMIRSFATEKHATAATTRERAETGNKNYERKAKVQIFAFTLTHSLTFTIVLQIMIRLLLDCPVTSTTEQFPGMDGFSRFAIRTCNQSPSLCYENREKRNSPKKKEGEGKRSTSPEVIIIINSR